MTDWYHGKGHLKLADSDAETLPEAMLMYAPPLRRPSKIWGIGLNYVAHAGDLDEVAPQEIPASFMKPATAIIGHGATIKIPVHSHRTTGEAELGIVIGRTCKNVDPEKWLDYIAGFVGVIDMTAEDILRQNPRYLTLSKSFDTFFSFGPYLVTPDEIEDVLELEVATVINGSVHAQQPRAQHDLYTRQTAGVSFRSNDVAARGYHFDRHTRGGRAARRRSGGMPYIRF